MRTCSSCGGIIGRECFNPDECALIAMQQDHQRQMEQERTNYTLEQQVADLQNRVEQLEQSLRDLINSGAIKP